MSKNTLYTTRKECRIFLGVNEEQQGVKMPVNDHVTIYKNGEMQLHLFRMNKLDYKGHRWLSWLFLAREAIKRRKK